MAHESDEIHEQQRRLYGVMRTARTKRDEASINATPLPGAPTQVPSVHEGILRKLHAAFDVAEKQLREFETKHQLRRMG